MKGTVIFVAATACACAIAVPAVIGLSGTPSFSQHIPVRAPAAAHVITFDDHGRAVEQESSRSAARPSATPTSIRVRSREPADDRGGVSGRRHSGGSDDRGHGGGRDH